MVSIKPLSDVVDEIIQNISPTADPVKIRDSIEEELYLKIFPVVDDLYYFVNVSHKYKRELYDFVDDIYRKQLTFAYNEWAEDKNVFGENILLTITDSLNMDTNQTSDFISKNTEKIHQIIWNDFVNPIRQRIWNLPTVYIRGPEHTIKSVLQLLRDNRQTLSKLLDEVCKS